MTDLFKAIDEAIAAMVLAGYVEPSGVDAAGEVTFQLTEEGYRQVDARLRRSGPAGEREGGSAPT